MGWNQVVIETDSKLLVEAIWLKSPDNSYFGCLVKDYLSLLHVLFNCNVQFIRRSANQVAHVRARAFGSMSGPKIWFHSYPAFYS